MQFVDNVTPSTGRQYFEQLENVTPDRGMWFEKRDEQTARDFMSMYYQNAYNTAMMNYMNEYNSPLQQMLRYQEAGLNPFLAANDAGNMGSPTPGAAPKGSSAVSPTPTDYLNTANQSIGQLNNSLKTAQQVYDYITYGRPLQEAQLSIQGFRERAAQAEATIKNAEADWSLFWNYGPDFGANAPYVQGSPRAQYMQESTALKSQQIEQLKALVDVVYPSQAEANQARAALTTYQQQVMEGEKGAILNIDTGNATADSILKLVSFWIMNSFKFGFSHRF